MAKGKTTQPLRIKVAACWQKHPKIEELFLAGHHISFIETDDADLILHPAAHNWNDMMWDFLPAAVTAARARKRKAK